VSSTRNKSVFQLKKYMPTEMYHLNLNDKHEILSFKLFNYKHRAA